MLSNTYYPLDIYLPLWGIPTPGSTSWGISIFGWYANFHHIELDPPNNHVQQLPVNILHAFVSDYQLGGPIQQDISDLAWIILIFLLQPENNGINTTPYPFSPYNVQLFKPFLPSDTSYAPTAKFINV